LFFAFTLTLSKVEGEGALYSPLLALLPSLLPLPLLFFHPAEIRFCAPLRRCSKRQRRDDITAQPEGLG